MDNLNVSEVYLAGNDRERWSSMLEAHRVRWRAKDIALFSTAANERSLSQVVNARLPVALHQQYLEEYAGKDLQIQRLIDGPEQSVTGSDLLDEVEAADCAVHREYLVPNAIDAQVVWYFQTDDRARHTFSLVRERRDRDFPRTVIREVAQLIPHIKNSLSLAKRMAMQETLANDTLDAFDFAVVTLDAHGRVLHYNAMAERLMAEGTFRIRRGVLSHPDRACNQALAQAREAFRRGEGWSATFRWCHHHLRLEAIPNGEATRMIVSIRDCSRAPEVVARALGVTHAEACLATHLHFGGTLDSYAEDHGTSRHTVRNQLRSAFAKTDTHKQKDLVAKVAAAL